MSVVKLKMVKKIYVYNWNSCDVHGLEWQTLASKRWEKWFHPELKLLLCKLVYIKTLPFLKMCPNWQGALILMRQLLAIYLYRVGTWSSVQRLTKVSLIKESPSRGFLLHTLGIKLPLRAFYIKYKISFVFLDLQHCTNEIAQTLHKWNSSYRQIWKCTDPTVVVCVCKTSSYTLS